MELTALLPWLPSLFLHLVRVGAFLVGQPLFGLKNDSKMARIVLMFSLGSMFFWVNGMPIVPATSLMELGFLAAREAIIGLALGFCVRLMTGTMAIAGEILSHEMGFSMATIVDPATGRSSPVVSQLFQTVGFLLIFELNIHHHVLLSFASVYEVVPVGDGFSVEPIVKGMGNMVSESIEFGIRYAMPVLGVMVMLTAVLVMLARAVPNINLLEFTFGLRILLALLASIYFLVSGAPLMEHMFEHTLASTRQLFGGP